MTLTLDVSPETVQRVERAESQGANMDTLLCIVLEKWFNDTETEDASDPHFLVPLAGKYEGEAWQDLLTEIKKNRQQEAQPSAEEK